MQIFIATFRTRSSHHDWNYEGKNEQWTTVQVRVSLLVAENIDDAKAQAEGIHDSMWDSERSRTDFEVAGAGELVTIGEFREG